MAPLWQIFIFWDPKTPLYKSKDTLATNLVTFSSRIKSFEISGHPCNKSSSSVIHNVLFVACSNSLVQSSLSLGRTNRLVKCAKPSGFCKPENYFCFQYQLYECWTVRKRWKGTLGNLNDGVKWGNIVKNVWRFTLSQNIMLGCEKKIKRNNRKPEGPR